MQPAACREAKTANVSGIRRDFRLNQHDIKHASKNKKSASTIEALFPSGGNSGLGVNRSNSLAPFRWVRHLHGDHFGRTVQFHLPTQKSYNPDPVQHFAPEDTLFRVAE